MTLFLYQGKPLGFFEQPVKDKHPRGCCDGSFAPAAEGLALEYGRVPHERGTSRGHMGDTKSRSTGLTGNGMTGHSRVKNGQQQHSYCLTMRSVSATHRTVHANASQL